ncbi:hypothetical protein [Phenylobacterium sp.]|jgi:hypothetical protein|uniref:hypothetical protein n=1 Tax=Phenylobacterium sp. TaxID=1871053 RepID=UPI0012120EF4|nr:hypothetical protein [Phenylobacterium sp.]THD51094.1 MAG: hypothetical protein E8A12_21645 [Phenylobacterium sp.]
MKLHSLVLLAGAALAILPQSIAAQPAATPYHAPRAVDGQPDLQGTWTNATLTPLERPVAMGDRRAMSPEEVQGIEGKRAEVIRESSAPTAATVDLDKLPCYAANTVDSGATVDCGYNAFWVDHGDAVMRVNGEPRTSMITFPANGRMPPRLPRKSSDPTPVRGVYGRAGENPENQTLAERCITSFANHAGPVMLPSFYNSNYQIVQGRDSVAILVEMIHDVRIVRLNAQHSPMRVWYGDSIGHYEGDTLVVETTNYNPNEALFGGSANMKVTERFTRVGPKRLRYEFKVEDPTVWATSWGGEYEFSPAKGPVYEYACHEGNYALPDILAGARSAEAEAAKKNGGGDAAALRQ